MTYRRQRIKDPLDSQIMTGYMINKAVDKGTEYLTEALHCLSQAVTDTNEAEGEVVIQNVELGEVRRLLYESLAGLQKAEEAHLVLGKLLKDGGYRPITNQDFARFGVGGTGR